MAELLNHRHCKNCSRALAYSNDEELCDGTCRDEWKAYHKKRSRQALFLYVASAVLMVLLILQLAQSFQ